MMKLQVWKSTWLVNSKVKAGVKSACYNTLSPVKFAALNISIVRLLDC